MKGERILGFSNRGILILLFDLKVESKCGASEKQRVIVSSDSEKFHVFFSKKKKKRKRRRFLRRFFVKIFHRAFRILLPFLFIFLSFSFLRDTRDRLLFFFQSINRGFNRRITTSMKSEFPQFISTRNRASCFPRETKTSSTCRCSFQR